MDIIGQSFHIGKFPIGMDHTLAVTLPLPGVVDVDVGVSGSFQAAAHHGVGLGADRFVIDSFREVIPTVPTHGRCQRELGLSGSGNGEYETADAHHHYSQLSVVDLSLLVHGTTPGPCN